MLKYFELAVTISALLSFCYGVFRFVGKKNALYLHMIVFGVGCAFMGRLFETLQLFIYGEIPEGFHIGLLGIIGSFLFFFTANYGQMDSIVDDGSKELRKYRLIGFLAPVACFSLLGAEMLKQGINQSTTVKAVLILFISCATYYHLKHLVIPDVEYGVINCLRSYNLLALIYALLCITEYLADGSQTILYVIYTMMCLILILFIPVLERGYKKWTT